jgi:uncharacterized protein
MKAVLDTNVLAVIISRKSRFFPIWQSLRNGGFELLVTNQMLAEYEEIIGNHLSEEIARNVLDGLELLPNVVFLSKYFYWNLIVHDPDDDKFVDCAIAGGADYLVTDDKHFDVLKTTPFPKVAVLSPDEFLEIVLTM